VNLASGVAYVGGRTGEGRARTDDERRPAAGEGRGRGRWRESLNRDVTPGAWLTGEDGRAGVTACTFYVY